MVEKEGNGDGGLGWEKGVGHFLFCFNLVFGQKTVYYSHVYWFSTFST